MRWENKVPLTDFLSNISTKHYQNRFMYVEVIASQSSDVLGRMSIMKHRMQITQQENMIWWQNPLCSCNRRLHHCQKMTIMFVTNTPAVHVYLINSPPFNAVAKNVHLWYKHKLADVFSLFTGVSFINDCLLQPLLRINHPLLQLFDITDPLLSTVALFFRFYSHRLHMWDITVALYIAYLAR